MSRSVALVAALACSVAEAATAAHAQEAIPAAATFADTLGPPEMEVADNGDGLDGPPAGTPAGRSLVGFTDNDADDAESTITFVQLPDGLWPPGGGRLHPIGRSRRRARRSGTSGGR